MILNSVEVENFKAFSGKHRVVFEVPTATRNVYLIGGLNGAGKTSLVHAIVLALLGRSAAGLPGMFHSGRERRRNYEDWLTASFNYCSARGGQDMMSVALNVTDEMGNSQTVRRSWWFDGTRGLEEEAIEVVPFGNKRGLDPLSGVDAEAVITGLLPRHMGELLFFDGEDLRLVAPDGKTIQVESMLDRLLGLEPIKRLVGDLGRIIELRRVELASPAQQKALEAMQQQVETAVAQFSESRAHLQATETVVAEVEAELVRLEDMTSATLKSDSPLTIAQLRSQIEDLNRRRREKRQNLGRSLGDWLFMLPTWDALNGLLGQIDEAINQRSALDSQKLQAEAVCGFAEDLRDAIAAEGPVPATVDAVLKRVLQGHLDRSVDMTYQGSFADFRQDELELAQVFAARLLSREMNDVFQLARDLVEIESGLERLEALRNSFTTSSQLERLVSRRYELQAVAGTLSAKRQLESVAADDARAALEQAQTAQRNLASAFSGNDAAQAWLEEAEDLRSAVADYVFEARGRALDTVEGALLAALRTLYRKTNYIQSVTIDSGTYEIRARDKNGEHLSMPSAGEQQLLALGLAQALLGESTQALPFFVDTPLGRLDSKHRQTVVRDYLPKVAKQVFVFSTDEEIVGELLTQLRPHLRGEYLITQYDESGNSMVQSQTYFEESR